MRLSLVITETNAVLKVFAENEFEKKSLESLERLPGKAVTISTEQVWGNLEKASLTVTFDTNPNETTK